MTPEERAEFDAALRDAELWRYFRDEARLMMALPDDPMLVICDRDGVRYNAELARVIIEEFYKRLIPV